MKIQQLKVFDTKLVLDGDVIEIDWPERTYILATTVLKRTKQKNGCALQQTQNQHEFAQLKKLRPKELIYWAPTLEHYSPSALGLYTIDLRREQDWSPVSFCQKEPWIGPQPPVLPEDPQQQPSVNFQSIPTSSWQEECPSNVQQSAPENQSSIPVLSLPNDPRQQPSVSFQSIPTSSWQEETPSNIQQSAPENQPSIPVLSLPDDPRQQPSVSFQSIPTSSWQEEHPSNVQQAVPEVQRQSTPVLDALGGLLEFLKDDETGQESVPQSSSQEAFRNQVSPNYEAITSPRIWTGQGPTQPFVANSERMLSRVPVNSRTLNYSHFESFNSMVEVEHPETRTAVTYIPGYYLAVPPALIYKNECGVKKYFPF